MQTIIPVEVPSGKSSRNLSRNPVRKPSKKKDIGILCGSIGDPSILRGI